VEDEDDDDLVAHLERAMGAYDAAHAALTEIDDASGGQVAFGAHLHRTRLAHTLVGPAVVAGGHGDQPQDPVALVGDLVHGIGHPPDGVRLEGGDQIVGPVLLAAADGSVDDDQGGPQPAPPAAPVLLGFVHGREVQKAGGTGPVGPGAAHHDLPAVGTGLDG